MVKSEPERDREKGFGETVVGSGNRMFKNSEETMIYRRELLKLSL